MREQIEIILNNYILAKQEPFAGHAMGKCFRQELPKSVFDTGLVTPEAYKITGSIGQGTWASVPWLGVFRREITTSATKGIYIVYLLSKDGGTLYLTFEQACTDIREKNSKRETIRIMRSRAKEIVSRIDARGFRTDEEISLGENLPELAELYQKGVIFYKAYHKEAIPSEEELRDDLSKMLDIYTDYAQLAKSRDISAEDTAVWFPSAKDYDPGISKDKWLELLENPTVFTKTALEMMAEFYAFGGVATCSQLGEHYRREKNYYLTNSVNLAKQVVQATGCPVMEDKQRSQNMKFWPVLYLGRDANKDEAGSFVWKIRGELYEALSEYGIEKHLPNRDADRTGSFDSWDIIDENTAIKHCDKSFFEHKGSGIPREICWFFGVKGIGQGETRQITLNYNGQAYKARISNESSDRRRVRIFWNSELSRLFNNYYSLDALAEFKKTSEDTYTVTIKAGEKQMTTREKISAIKAYIASKGFNYDGDLIENFYLSLKSKPFVILAGTSGTGKTRLVKLFAEAIGAEMKLVPVRPDWSDSSDLFGYNDLSGNFHPGAIIDFIKQAEQDISNPYFLCLDEMNLARVEYYLSDFLSIIETRELRDNGTIETDPLVEETYYQKDEAKIKYGKVYIPENLYIVGTVNMDETTFPFSKKVLDRANTIEFSVVNLKARATANGQAAKQQLDNSFLKSEYLYLRDCDDDELIDDVCSELESLNQILVKANLHVGYRVRDEVCFYMMNNKNADLLTFDAAFDHEIMQKILPRIQGSSSAIKDVLAEMFVKCAGDYSGFTGAVEYEQMNSYLDSKPSKYPNSAKKIAFMMRRYTEDGFTSYWL